MDAGDGKPIKSTPMLSHQAVEPRGAGWPKRHRAQVIKSLPLADRQVLLSWPMHERLRSNLDSPNVL